MVSGIASTIGFPQGEPGVEHFICRPVQVESRVSSMFVIGAAGRLLSFVFLFCFVLQNGNRRCPKRMSFKTQRRFGWLFACRSVSCGLIAQLVRAHA